jgi:hypothetical protein
MNRFIVRPARPEEHTNYVVEDTAYGRIALSVASLNPEIATEVAERLNHLYALRPGLSTDEINDLDWLVRLWQPGRYLEVVE